jgi:hypothetical protein
VRASTVAHAVTATLTDPANSPPAGAQSVVFSPDSKTLAIVDGPAVYLWTTAAQTRSAVLFDQRGKGMVIDCAGFSPDGRTLAAGEYGPAPGRPASRRARSRPPAGSAWSKITTNYAP